MNPPALTLSEFPVSITLPVLWGDQDAIGHVNNTTFIRWFESVRIAYLEHIGAMEAGERIGVMNEDPTGPILAAVNCNFRQQVKYPAQVTIAARVATLGRTSVTMQHAVFDADRPKQPVADGESVVVMFNYETNRPVRLPPELISRIKQLQPEL